MTIARDIAKAIGASVAAGNIGSDGAVSGGTTSYDSADALATSGNTAGDFAFVKNTQAFYGWDSDQWIRLYGGADEPLSWTTEANDTYTLELSDSATVTTVAADPEGYDVTYSFQTTPSNQSQVTITNNNDGTYSLISTDSAANAGSFTLRTLADDGLHKISKNSTITVVNELTNADYTNLVTWDFGTSNTNVTSYNSTYKIEGSHSGYISGDSIDRQPGAGTSNTAITFNDEYCIAMWVRIDTFKSSYNTFYPWGHGGKSNPGNSFGPCHFLIQSNGTITFNTANYNGSAYSGIQYDVGDVATDTWYHIIAAAKTNGTVIKVWMSEEGGTFAGKANLSGFQGMGSRTQVDNLIVGPGNSNWYLHGSIGTLSSNGTGYYDDVRIYDAIPTDTEAEAIFNTNGSLIASTNPLQSNLRFAYQFNNSRSAGIT